MNVRKYKYINNDRFESPHSNVRHFFPSLSLYFNTTRTENRSINYMKPERIYKVRIVRASYVNVMKTQNNANEKPNDRTVQSRSKKNAHDRQNGKNAEINKETSLLFPIQHQPFIIGNPLKWFISFKTWCMCINDLWISNNFRTRNQQKHWREVKEKKNEPIREKSWNESLKDILHREKLEQRMSAHQNHEHIHTKKWMVILASFAIQKSSYRTFPYAAYKF